MGELLPRCTGRICRTARRNVPRLARSDTTALRFAGAVSQRFIDPVSRISRPPSDRPPRASVSSS